MKHTFTLFIIYLLITFSFSCGTSVDKKKTEIDQAEKTRNEIKSNIREYDYETILSNGFHLKYFVFFDEKLDDTIQCLFLMREDKKISELNCCSYSLLLKNLGYIGADFGDSFAFVQSFGSGNPHELQLIEKKTGKEIIKGVWVDVNENEKVIVYIINLHEENEELRLFDLKNDTDKLINDFKDAECTQIGGLRDCIKIDSISASEVWLKMETIDGSITKKYSR